MSDAKPNASDRQQRWAVAFIWLGFALLCVRLAVLIDGHAVKDYLATDADRPEVAAEDLRARRMNIDAVPCFIVDGQYAISGAQEPEAFYPLLDLANFSRQAAE